jgi:hypothetical protein
MVCSHPFVVVDELRLIEIAELGKEKQELLSGI